MDRDIFSIVFLNILNYFIFNSSGLRDNLVKYSEFVNITCSDVKIGKVYESLFLNSLTQRLKTVIIRKTFKI